MVFYGMTELFWVCGAAIVAGFTQGLTGFGAVLVGLPMFTAVIGIKTAAPLANCLSVWVSLYLCVRFWRLLQFRSISLLVLGALPGIPVGAWLLGAVSARSLEIALAVTLLLHCLQSTLSNGHARTVGTLWAGVAGFASGLLGGSIGAYGPPVVMFFSARPTSGEVDKASMSGFFLLVGAGVAGVQAVGGFIDAGVLRLTALALPALAFGAVLGSFCHARIGDRLYQKVVLGMLVLMALLLLVKPA